MALKVTMFFNQWNAGWTETLYHPDGTTPPADLTNDYKWLCQYRANLLSTGGIVTALRISVEGKRNLANTFNLVQKVQREGWPTEFGNSADVVSTDALYSLSMIGGGSRIYTFRGLPDAGVERDSQGNPTLRAEFSTRAFRFFNRAYTMGLGMRQLVTPSINPAIKYLPVRSIAISPTNFNNSLVQTSEALVFLDPLNKALVFKGGKYRNELPGFPRSVPVLAESNAGGVWSYEIPYRVRGGNTVVPPGMAVIGLSYVYKGIGDWTFRTFSSRKTGRPIGARRGRSQVVFTRQ